MFETRFPLTVALLVFWEKLDQKLYGVQPVTEAENFSLANLAKHILYLEALYANRNIPYYYD